MSWAGACLTLECVTVTYRHPIGWPTGSATEIPYRSTGCRYSGPHGTAAIASKSAPKRGGRVR